MKLNKALWKLAAVGGCFIGFSGGVSAQCIDSPGNDYLCFFINNTAGAGATGAGGDGRTASIRSLGLTDTLATSVYFGLTTGSTIVDTNRTSVLNQYGLNTGGATVNIPTIAPGNPTKPFNDTPSFAQKNVDALNPLAAFPPTPPSNDIENFGTGWGLSFDYTFNGTLTATGPAFTSGDIVFRYSDLLGNNVPILRLNVTGSDLTAANLAIFGSISFDFDGNGTNDCTTSFCQNFWNFTGTDERWYDLNQAEVTIKFALDTNVDPPIPAADQLIATFDGDGNQYFIRQTELDSSLEFNRVPEPGTMALVGLALLGLAGASRRRRH